MRKRQLFVAGFVALVSVACSDSTSPNEPPPPPLYPALSGAFQIQATFDAFPTSLANGSGTITFVQADRDLPGLVATGTLAVVAGGTTGTLTEFRNVALTTAGAISFQAGSASSTAAWGFDGTLSTDGRTITGRHALVGSTTSFVGNWTATKQ